MRKETLGLLEDLPAAVYTTDAEGRITFFNNAAAELWGRQPDLGKEKWCGSHRLLRPDGSVLPHDECPMADAIRLGAPQIAIGYAERPDGERVAFRAFPAPLRDDSGNVTGAINVMVDATLEAEEDIARAHLAAIVEGSNDAIISKTLDGRITSWNAGAQRIFGYTAEEMIGQSVLRLVPPELRSEEEDILSRLKNGERIEHFDTIRVTKDGRRIHVSLTVSPLRDRSGQIVGASKIARDITERKQAEDMQRLLFNELNHRVKNMLAAIQAIASQSLRDAEEPEQFVSSFSGRLRAMGRAHDLLVRGRMEGAEVFGLVREHVIFGPGDSRNISLSGPCVVVEDRAAVQLALVLHELATNARKYGALSRPDGHLSISWRLETAPERTLLLEWRESGVTGLTAPARRGFGTRLIERSLDANNGDAAIRYGPDGLICDIRLPLPDGPSVLRGAPEFERARDIYAPPRPETNSTRLTGRRVLVIEDEPLIAMDVESQLEAAGCKVAATADSIDAARRLIEAGGFDLAIMDANLGGEPVDDLAAMLEQRGTPFLFATGYGPEALPHAFGHIMTLTKPFAEADLIRALSDLAGEKTVAAAAGPRR